MARFIKSNEPSAGKAPGSLVFIGNQKLDQSIIKISAFDAHELNEYTIEDVDECTRYLTPDSVTWVSVYGLHDTDNIKRLGELFSIHPLVLEDILNTGQRPKFEEYDEYIFLVLKILRFDTESMLVQGDQLSIVLGDNYLISFHEQPVDIFQPVRERIRKHRGRIRQGKSDYLAYALLDTVVDNYIICIEKIGCNVEELEEAVLEDPSPDILSQITNYKREVNYLRKTIRPARELIISLAHCDNEILRESTTPYLKDLKDLISHAVEATDNYREMLSDQLGIYNTAIGNRLNEIMKILTIFAAIFIPLTFIAGIYGTNFENVPELKYKYSYYFFWGIMATVAILMIRFFKKKGWM
ncbi:magnesium/cobalt transporter CorA [Desulfogranum japonicum]|uniref:magnesium/cobalt transporter CorA n=1 Tax=Desulfogranum japonicum TaxID=231447 RepID=UPI00048C203C|nr:magnesium/cobalt transporter CorA [Desulfogranum japonicum]